MLSEKLFSMDSSAEVSSLYGLVPRTSVDFTFKPTKRGHMAKQAHGKTAADYILDSTVVDPAGKVLYTLTSDAKRKKWTTICDATGAEVSRLDWDHMFSPRMTFRGGDEIKCKAFIPYQDKNKTKRWLQAGATANVYSWIPGEEDNHDMITPWDQPGYAVAIIKSNSRREIVCELVYEAFEAPEFIDALITAVALIYGKGGDLGRDLVVDGKDVMKILNGMATVASIASVL
ncbi:unnamed protein product [Peniophora sp. CBMAI 1063]|nr:unnamed protein product [Peniophora sp. CBMAI 1063]